MTTKTARNQAATATRRTKRAADSAGKGGGRTAAQARAAATAAQRTVRTAASDAGYATVGLSDTAIAYLRTLPTRLQRVDRPGLEETPRLIEARLEALGRNAEREFNVLAERGRNVVETLSARNSAAQRATGQARTARQQLKAAGTSLRRAVFSGAEAAQSTAQTAGRQAEREQYEGMTVAELQDLARRKGITNRSGKNKQELVRALLDA